MIRTSESHPLQIGSIPVGAGHLGLTFCPGKKGQSMYGPAWSRDLEADLERIEAWGAAAVVTLMETHEFDMLGVPTLGEAVRARGLEWCHFPILDVSVPTPEAMTRWAEVSARLHALLDEGRGVVVHCRGGLGRAGTMAALLLVERGWAGADAISEVRTVRPGAVETRAQEAWVLEQARQAKDNPQG
jgi:ADP-ribosyl-[dinitrogen reductase] hydrolase